MIFPPPHFALTFQFQFAAVTMSERLSSFLYYFRPAAPWGSGRLYFAIPPATDLVSFAFAIARIMIFRIYCKQKSKCIVCFVINRR